jgi:Flp pilus assembly protein TadD
MSLRPALIASSLLLCLATATVQGAPVPTQPVRPLGPAGGGQGAKVAFQQGLAALKAKRHDEARKAFTAALKADPQQIESMLGLAEVGFAARDDAETLKWLQQAERTAPQRAEVHAVLGRYYMARRQPEKAEAALRKAVQFDAKSVSSRLDLANALLARGAGKEAIPLLQEVLKLDAKQAGAQYALGLALMQTGAQADGERQLKQAAELDAKNPLPWLALARAQKTAAAAYPYLDQALERQPEQFDALMLRAHWQMSDKNNKAARDSLERAAKANEKSAEPLVRLGLMAEAEGRRSDAKRHYMAAIERDGFQPVALNNLVMMGLADKDDPGRLELMARRAVKALPDNPAVHDTLAQTLRQRKDKAGTLAAAQQAAKLAPNDAAMQLSLAEAQQWNGDRAGAKRSVEAVLALQKQGKEADRARELLARL